MPKKLKSYSVDTGAVLLVPGHTPGSDLLDFSHPGATNGEVQVLAYTKADAIDHLKQAGLPGYDQKNVRLSQGSHAYDVVDRGLVIREGDVVVYIRAQRDRPIVRLRGGGAEHIGTWRYTSQDGLTIEVHGSAA